MSLPPVARTLLTWAPLACAVAGAAIGFLVLDPAMRGDDPALVTEAGRALAYRQVTGIYRLALVGAAVSLLWAMGVRMFTTAAAPRAA